jgi:hypothetical protein
MESMPGEEFTPPIFVFANSAFCSLVRYPLVRRVLCVVCRAIRLLYTVPFPQHELLGCPLSKVSFPDEKVKRQLLSSISKSGRSIYLPQRGFLVQSSSKLQSSEALLHCSSTAACAQSTLSSPASSYMHVGGSAIFIQRDHQVEPTVPPTKRKDHAALHPRSVLLQRAWTGTHCRHLHIGVAVQGDRLIWSTAT